MVDVASTEPINALRDTAILLLTFDTGVRSSEVCRLRPGDVVDGEHLASSVTVHGKGDKYRRIEMHPQTKNRTRLPPAASTPQCGRDPRRPKSRSVEHGLNSKVLGEPGRNQTSIMGAGCAIISKTD